MAGFRVRGGGIDHWLTRKYDIQEQNSDANMLRAQGGLGSSLGMRPMMGGSGGDLGWGSGLANRKKSMNPFGDVAAMETEFIANQMARDAGIAGANNRPLPGIPGGTGTVGGLGLMSRPAANPDQTPMPPSWSNGGMAPGQASSAPGAPQLGFSDLQRNVMRANAQGSNIGYVSFAGLPKTAGGGEQASVALQDPSQYADEVKRFAKGTARVPGKGDGTRDTVKAKLAPGEAVLNKAAADSMGRGLINVMNKMGARKMGMI